jgi:hypothetical protein
MNLLDRPKRVYPVLVVLLVALWLLAAVGNSTNHNPKHGVRYTIGAIGWFGFLLIVLAMLVYTLALGIHVLRRRRSVA